MKLFWSTFALFLLCACAANPVITPVTPALPAPAISFTATPMPSPVSTGTPLPGQRVLMSAHRGGAGLAPENTLASFRNGLTFNPDFLEMDVHLTKDGSVVVIHDPTIDRTTDGKGRVSDFTLAELQALNAAAKYPGAATKEPVPTLGQVLDLAKPTLARLEVEIKVGADGKPYPGIAAKVLDEIDKRGMMDRVRIMAFEFETLKQLRALNSKVTTVALMTTDYFRGKDVNAPAAIVDEVAPYSSGIGVDKNFLSPKLVEAAHQRNLLVGVWTVDSEAEISKFVGMGVDSITSNRPDVLKKVLGR